jgi:hypothetical protein
LTSEEILINTGTMNFTAAITLPVLTFSGGTISGEGAVTVTGLSTWTGGSINSGAGRFTAAGALALGGSVNLSRTLEAQAAVSFSGTQLQINGGHFINRGTFTAESAGAQAISQFSTGLFTNHGIFTKRGEGTLTISSASFTHVAGSELRVEAGQLTAAAASSYTEMVITVTPGAALRWGNSTHTFNAGVTIDSEEILINTGTMNFTAAITLPLLTFSGGTISGEGAVTVTGLSTWTGGSINSGAGMFTAAGPLALGGSVNLSRTLEAQAAVSFSGTQLQISGGHFINRGTFTAESAGAQAISQFSTGLFTNHGIFTKRGEGTLTVSTGSFTHLAGAEMRVEEGTLNLINQSSYTGATVFAGAAGTLRWAAGTHTFDAASSLGGVSMLFAGATVNINGSYAVTGLTTVSSGTANFNAAAVLPELAVSGGSLGGSGEVSVAGTFTWSGGTLAGGTAAKLVANGPLVLPGATTLNRTLEARAATSFTGTQLTISAGHFFNFGIFTAERADAQSIPQSSFGSFTNHGEFVKLGAGTLGVSVGSFASTAGSAIDVLAGQLHITNTGGYAGTAITVAAGAALRWTGGAHTLDAASSLSAPEMFFSAATVTFNGLYDVPGLTTVASGDGELQCCDAVAGAGLQRRDHRRQRRADGAGDLDLERGHAGWRHGGQAGGQRPAAVARRDHPEPDLGGARGDGLHRHPIDHQRRALFQLLDLQRRAR